MMGRLLSRGALGFLAFVGALPLLLYQGPANAVGQEPSTLTVTAPAAVTLGETVTMEAQLVASAGPVAKATIQFVIPTDWLNTTADMVVGTGVTDGRGIATATFEARMTGALQVKAVFAGDNTYAASNALTALDVGGSQQLYVPDLGIRLRGLNTTPIGQDSTVSHWVLSGWPIGAVLVLVWSAYSAAVFFMSRISADTSNTPEVAP